MTKEKLKKILMSIFAIFVIIFISLHFIIGDQLKYKESQNAIVMPDADKTSIELTSDVVIRQRFVNNVEVLDSIGIVCHTYWRTNNKGTMLLELKDGADVIGSKEINVNEIPDQHRIYLDFDKPLKNLEGKELILEISTDSEEDEGVCLMICSANSEVGHFTINNIIQDGTICFATYGRDNVVLGEYYWYIVGGFSLLLSFLLYYSYKDYSKGKANLFISAILAIDRYRFLISQLVSRDFKSKYKRSVFGVFWSFLNPLLTMLVQFIVFSTFFKADTKNYSVYLISGVVCFSFFNQCTTKCLSSISGNYRLITKVYIPKYIFPLAKTISSSVDLVISLVPLLLVTIITGTQIHSSFLLIFFFLVCLIVFSLGIGLILSTLMVFFRDIEFLWSVICTIWQYATPIFYPAEIIPDKYRFIVQFNPLYHFIGCARKCLIDGISPEPIQFIYCLVFAAGALIVGSYIFKKCQDKFTLYL